MRILAPLLLAVALVTHAHAQSPLLGTWSVAIDGQPLVVTFENGGTGRVNGKPMKWQTFGQLLFVQQQGQQAITYSFQVQGEKLQVGGGDLNGMVTLTRGTAAADAAKKQQAAAKGAAPAGTTTGGNGQELVGKWCKMSTYSANSGGSQRSTCFELRADGTYLYQHESSMSATTGATASQSADAGRWKVAGNQLTAQSRSGSVNTYTLEKRNHPKNKRDPMICLNGECYVTFYNKPAW